MALPLRTTGSLEPTFVSARLVSLTVRRAYALALNSRFPTGLSSPSRASVTLSEATAPVKLPSFSVPDPANGTRLDTRKHKGRISTLAPPELAPELQSLRPILHIYCLVPLKNCSKGARGLSV